MLSPIRLSGKRGGNWYLHLTGKTVADLLVGTDHVDLHNCSSTAWRSHITLIPGERGLERDSFPAILNLVPTVKPSSWSGKRSKSSRLNRAPWELPVAVAPFGLGRMQPRSSILLGHKP